MWFWGTDLKSDLKRYRPNQLPTTWRLISVAASNPGLVACVLLRIEVRLFRLRRQRASELVRSLNLAWTGADFAPGCTVGPGLLIQYPNGIVIGAGALLGKDCTVLQQVTVGEKFADGRAPHDYPEIGDRAVIGAGARVLGKVRVGADAIIGANAVVTSDVPANATAVGVPARILNSNRTG